ncbi:MAG: hypothetical protein JXB05_00830 [Myxococcaceae bacterium]|nr:hypothetical protein [Myxococcaceae bacterium]
MPVESADGGGRSWLAESVREKRRLIWTGHGASFALAQVFAAVLEEQGCPTLSLPLSQCGGAEVCLVSQSARDPGIPVALLITEAGRKPDWTSVPRLEVPHLGQLEWLPLSFMREALRVFGLALGVPARPVSWVPQREPRSEILVVEQYVEPLRALVGAARHKLEGFPLEVASCDELGHGLHARLWRRPGAYRVRLLCLPGAEQGRMDAVRKWCEQAGTSLVEMRLATSTEEEAGTRPLEVFEQSLALIAELCVAHGIDWRERQVPAEADWLRDVRPGEEERVPAPGGKSCAGRS